MINCIHSLVVINSYDLCKYYLSIFTLSHCKCCFWEENIHGTQSIEQHAIICLYNIKFDYIGKREIILFQIIIINLSSLYKGISIPFREFSCSNILYMNTCYNIEIIGNILQQNILPANIRIESEEFIAHSSLSCSVSLIIWIWHMYRWRQLLRVINIQRFPMSISV